MIVDLDKAKGQIGVFNEDNDDRIGDIVDAAHAALFAHLKTDSATRYQNPDGEHDLPPDIAMATLLMCENLFNDAAANPLTPAVIALLNPHRDPAIA